MAKSQWSPPRDLDQMIKKAGDMTWHDVQMLLLTFRVDEDLFFEQFLLLGSPSLGCPSCLLVVQGVLLEPIPVVVSLPPPLPGVGALIGEVAHGLQHLDGFKVLHDQGLLIVAVDGPPIVMRVEGRAEGARGGVAVEATRGGLRSGDLLSSTWREIIIMRIKVRKE